MKVGYCWGLSLEGAEGRILLEQHIHVELQDVVTNADLTEELQVLQVHQERLKNKHFIEFSKKPKSCRFGTTKALSHLNGAKEAQVIQRDEAQEDGDVVYEPGGGVEIRVRDVITLRS